MIEFINKEDAIAYAEKGWKPFFDSLPESKRSLLLSMQGAGRRINEITDKPIIEAYKEAMLTTPCVEDDIVVYRGGSMDDFSDERPFLAASFIKSTAEKYAEGAKLFKIIIMKGAPIIPTCGMGEEVKGCRPEEEVELETKRLKWDNKTSVFYYR